MNVHQHNPCTLNSLLGAAARQIAGETTGRSSQEVLSELYADLKVARGEEDPAFAMLVSLAYFKVDLELIDKIVALVKEEENDA
jgi:hypothetical protein